MEAATPERAAKRLLRWYPPTWRERYGDEFTELLIADVSERPNSSGRTLNIIGSGLLARLSDVGLTGRALEGPDQTRASLAVLTCSLAAYLALGIAMWSQLTIGWQWSAPNTRGTTIAVLFMSLGVVLFAILAVCATMPLLWAVVRAFAQRKAVGLGRPALLVALGLLVVIVGSRHFGNGWPGTGGHPWAHQGLVPGGVAAFSWASTLSISSYWMHPSALLAFPPAEVAWMIASPIAMVMVAAGSAKIVRRVQMSERILRFEVILGEVAAGSMGLFLCAACVWVIEGGAGPRGLFQTGAIDRLALGAMTGALVLAMQSLHRARRSGFVLRVH
jgi:hypothetical protein